MLFDIIDNLILYLAASCKILLEKASQRNLIRNIFSKTGSNI